MYEITTLGEIDIVILAGGEGRRVRRFFPHGPKSMLPICGKPFVHHLLDQIRSFGGRRVVFALGHLSDVLVEYLKGLDSSDLEMVTHVESPLRGTGGALQTILPLLRSQTVLVMNGDSYTRVDLSRFLAFHRERQAQLSMVLTYQGDMANFGCVETGEDGHVRSFVEKQPSTAGGYISTGLYLIDRAVIDSIPSNRSVSLEREVFPRYCRQSFYAMKGRFPFIDIGTAESYARAESFFRDAQSAARAS